MLKKWGMDADEVLDEAMLNTYCMAQPRIYLSPFECINPPFERGAFMSFNSPITSLDKWSIPTVTTTKLTNGAIAIALSPVFTTAEITKPSAMDASTVNHTVRSISGEK